MSSPGRLARRAGNHGPGKSVQTRAARAWNLAGPARQNDRMPPADDTALDTSTAPDTAAGPLAASSTGAASIPGGAAAHLTALRDACTRFLHSHGPVRAADLLATVPTDTVPDRYGDGGVVAELEAEIKLVLGKPAAVFLPSGTMAQQSVLRVHADQRQRRVIAFHPTCHLDGHEDRGYERLHRLTGRPVGERHRLLTVDDLGGIAEPVAALLLELPQREIGGQQPAWDELVAQIQWARERGAAVHLDGARLWESAAGYQQPPGPWPACSTPCTCRSTRAWARCPDAAWPGRRTSSPRCASGGTGWAAGCTACGRTPRPHSACLARRLPDDAAVPEHTRAIADVLRDLPGVQVVPDPPQSPMMHVLLRHQPGRLHRGRPPAGRPSAAYGPGRRDAHRRPGHPADRTRHRATAPWPSSRLRYVS